MKIVACIFLLIIGSCKTSLKAKKNKVDSLTLPVTLQNYIPPKLVTGDICGYGHGNKELNLLWYNYLENTNWVIDSIFGLNMNIIKYALTKFKDKIKWAGNYIHFMDSSHFKSGYPSWCRNDCFTTVNGQYKFKGENVIEIIIDSIFYDRECTKPTEYLKKNELRFVLLQNTDTLIIKKYYANNINLGR